MCEGASKQTLDLKFYRPPPRFEIPGSATDTHMEKFKLWYKIIKSLIFSLTKNTYKNLGVYR